MSFLARAKVRSQSNRRFSRQITVNGVAVNEALDLCAGTVQKRTMFERVKRWRDRLKSARKDELIAEIALVELQKDSTPLKLPTPPSPPVHSPPVPSLLGETASSFFQTKRKSPPKKRKVSSLSILGGILEKEKPENKVRSNAQIQAINNLPEWMDKQSTVKTMFTRKKRTRKDKCKDDYEEKSKKEYRMRKYSTVWKMATAQLHENNSGPSKGKRGYGGRAVAKKYNALLASPGDKKLSHSSLSAEVLAGRFGVSPNKIGRPPIIPQALKRAAALQTVLMQVNGETEASKSKLLSVSHALVNGTKWEGTFSHQYLFNAARRKYPEIMNPVKAKSHEDRRVDWLSYKNIHDWTDRVREYLIGIDMLSPEPGYIHGVKSNCSLVHEDDVDHFIVMDETHHKFSTGGNKGGSSESRYSCSSFSRPGDCAIENERHTTGCYGFTLRGEALPPLYILDSKAKDEDNFKFDPRVCEGLPMPTAKLGQKTPRKWPSSIAIRKKGGMNSSLWHELNRKVYLPGWKGKISKTTVRDPVTKKLITGPLINKTDAGPGRLATEAESIDFREEMADIGMHILLSIPNGTECNAEPDQLYGEFKPRCKNSTIRVAGVKMHARVLARKKGSNRRSASAIDDLAEYLHDADPKVSTNIEDGVEADVDNDDAVDDFNFNVGSSVCSVNVGNLDLGHIVNGFVGDPIEKRPFDYCFQKHKLINQWIKVGFLPMTYNAVNDPKVRFELGDGGAPPEMTARIEMLVKDYEDTGSLLSTLGFNGHVLDIKPRMAEEITLPEDEEATIKHIIDNKIISKAGGLFKCGVHVANCRVVLEAAKRMKEVEKEKRKQKDITDGENKAKKCWIAVTHFMKWKADGEPEVEDIPGRPRLTRLAAIAIVREILPRISPEENVTQYTAKGKSIDRLMAIRGGTTWEIEMQAIVDEEGDEGGAFPVTGPNT
jgi:hypothetical protein